MPAGRRVQEGDPFAGHGVLVAAGEIEGAGLDLGEISRHGDKTVIAVDGDQGLFVRDGARAVELRVDSGGGHYVLRRVGG